MAVRYVLDSNAVLYLLGGKLTQPLPNGEYFVSVITEMELLSFPLLNNSEELAIREFLRDTPSIELSSEIRETAILLRKQHRLKLPDAIVAATAKALGATLLTNDRKLTGITGIESTRVSVK